MPAAMMSHAVSVGTVIVAALRAALALGVMAAIVVMPVVVATALVALASKAARAAMIGHHVRKSRAPWRCPPG